MLLRGGKVSKTHLLHYFRASLAKWILDFSDNEEKMTADGKEKEKKTRAKTRVHHF